MNKRTRFSFPTVGGSFLLVIFAVLCLTVFALLALATVQAGQRLSDASAAAVTNYYAADYQAEEILAQLRTGETPEGVTQVDDIYMYECPVSDTQVLKVEVRLDGTAYTILRWQTVSIADWQPEDGMQVWDGEAVN